MADPLSIAASIAGLLSITGQIAKSLSPYVSAAKETPQVTAHVCSEVQSTQVILAGLQDLTQNLGAVQARHAALVGVHQVVTIFTDGVLLFSELEAAVRSLPPREGSHQRLPLRARLQWARKESTFSTLLIRVQGFKISMSLILAILQSDSDRLAAQHQEQLSINVNALLESNHSLSRRLMNLENALDVQTVVSRRMSLMSLSGTRPQPSNSVETQPTLINTPEQSTGEEASSSMSKFDFEDDLESSRVYRRAQRDTMDFSFRSSVAPSNIWSVFSGLSLGDISIMSVIALPVYQEDITNAQHYDFGAGIQVPIPIPQPREKRSHFHECAEIKLKMLQLPGMSEYFDDNPTPDIAFYELWNVLRKGKPLLKLVEVLDPQVDPQVDIVVDPGLYPPDGQPAAQAIFRFLEFLRNHLKLGVNNSFTISDLMGHDAYGFSKVIDVMSLIFGELTTRGVVSAIDAQLSHLSPIRDNVDPDEEQASLLLEEFLVHQHSFVRQLEELVEIQSLIELDDSLSRNDATEIFWNARQLASLHIDLLVRMMWTSHLRVREQRWSYIFDAYLYNISEESDFAANEGKARAKIRSCLDQEIGSRLRTSLTSCLRTISLPAQRLPEYTALLEDLSSIAGMSAFQKQDLMSARVSAKQAMDAVNDKVRSVEANKALAELYRRVEDWKGHKPAQFGTLLLYDSVAISVNNIRRPYRAYLFESILLVCSVSQPKQNGKGLLFWRNRPAQKEKEMTFRLKGRIFASNIEAVITHSHSGHHRCQVVWRGGETESFLLEFTSEAQMRLWASKINEIKDKNGIALSEFEREMRKRRHGIVGLGPRVIDSKDDNEADAYDFLFLSRVDSRAI